MSSREAGDLNMEFLHRAIDESIIFVFYNFPLIKRTTVDVLEHIFQTKALAKQLALAIALETGMVTANQVMHVIRALLSNLSSKSRLIHHLQRQQGKADTRDEWMNLAERIDAIQGDDVWRSDPKCQLYERERISARVDEFVHLMRRHDVFELMFVLRGGIARNKFGLLHEGLFSKAMAGSKVLVETYHNVVCAALDFVCDAPVKAGDEPIPLDARLAFFNETRHSYGRTALLLSGGAAAGMYHMGVVKALMEKRLLPRVISGASAGSIVCAMIGTRTDEECMNDLFDLKGTKAPGHSGTLGISFLKALNLPLKPAYAIGDLGENDKEITDKSLVARFVPAWIRGLVSVMFDLATLRTHPSDLIACDTEFLRDVMRANVGEFTFQEAFDRTGRILNITVTPTNSSDPPRLLNYLTAPHVVVWSASVASSSLPGVFGANRLMVKDADGTVRYETSEPSSFSDGSLEGDLPMQQLAEMFNVNHFIISQANPHAAMFASFNSFRNIWSNPITGFVNSVLTFLKNRCRTWLAHVVELIGARRFAPTHATSRAAFAQFFVQEYEGRHCDISLIPWIGHRSVFSACVNVLYNPSGEELKGWLRAAERETWKYIPAISSHIAEEITLDRCVQRLRKRMAGGQKRRKTGGNNMDERVPSFFTSPSLTKIEDENQSEAGGAHGDKVGNSMDEYDATDSSRAGLESEGANQSTPLEIGDVPSTSQAPGEAADAQSTLLNGAWDDEEDGYVKSSGGMAHFYYRNTSSHGNLNKAHSGEGLANDRTLLQRQKTLSHPHLSGSARQ